jgi:hypothetical protein
MSMTPFVTLEVVCTHILWEHENYDQEKVLDGVLTIWRPNEDLNDTVLREGSEIFVSHVSINSCRGKIAISASRNSQYQIAPEIEDEYLEWYHRQIRFKKREGIKSIDETLVNLVREAMIPLRVDLQELVVLKIVEDCARKEIQVFLGSLICDNSDALICLRLESSRHRYWINRLQNYLEKCQRGKDGDISICVISISNVLLDIKALDEGKQIWNADWDDHFRLVTSNRKKLVLQENKYQERLEFLREKLASGTALKTSTSCHLPSGMAKYKNTLGHVAEILPLQFLSENLDKRGECHCRCVEDDSSSVRCICSYKAVVFVDDGVEIRTIYIETDSQVQAATESMRLHEEMRLVVFSRLQLRSCFCNPFGKTPHLFWVVQQIQRQSSDLREMIQASLESLSEKEEVR